MAAALCARSDSVIFSKGFTTQSRKPITRAWLYVVVPALFFVNLAMQGFPWFIFPSAFLVLSTLMRAGNLWADGISPATALRGGWRERG